VVRTGSGHGPRSDASAHLPRLRSGAHYRETRLAVAARDLIARFAARAAIRVGRESAEAIKATRINERAAPAE